MLLDFIIDCIDNILFYFSTYIYLNILFHERKEINRNEVIRSVANIQVPDDKKHNMTNKC